MRIERPGWVVDDATPGNPQRVLDREDPLPASSIAALARLRRAAGWGRGR